MPEVQSSEPAPVNGSLTNRISNVKVANVLKERFAQDPALDIPGMAPNFGQFPIPHVMTLQGLVTNISRVYRISDDALNDSFDNARFMEYDIGIWECIEARTRSSVLLDWHLEPEDEKDPEQVQCCEELTKVLKYTPRFMQVREQLMLAAWYGRSAVQCQYNWDWINHKSYIRPTAWLPIHGDKLVFRLMDDTLDHLQGQVGIRVGQTYKPGDRIVKRSTDMYGNRTQHWQVEPTDRGLAYFLTEPEQRQLIIHKHQIQDAAFERPQDAGRIHGVGIRNRIYWEWFMKQNTLRWLMEYIERSAFGLELWFYPMHNEKARLDAEAAIKARVGPYRNVLMVPIPPDDGSGQQYGVQHVETGLAGADLLLNIVDKYFGHRIKRLILGQTLTTEADATGLGSGVASIHLLSFRDIVKYDCVNLQETITDWINYSIKPYNFPRSSHFRVRFVIETEPVDADEKLSAYEKAWNMGARIREKDVYDAIGAAAPNPKDVVLPPAGGMPASVGLGGPGPGEVPPGADSESGQGEEEKGAQQEDAAQEAELAAELAQQGQDPEAGRPVIPGQAAQYSQVARYADGGEDEEPGVDYHKSPKTGDKYRIGYAKHKDTIWASVTHVPTGADVGKARFTKNSDGTYTARNVEVHKDHRRHGVASAIYRGLEKRGHKITPSKVQTEEGEVFSKNRHRYSQSGGVHSAMLELVKHHMKGSDGSVPISSLRNSIGMSKEEFNPMVRHLAKQGHIVLYSALEDGQVVKYAALPDDGHEAKFHEIKQVMLGHNKWAHKGALIPVQHLRKALPHYTKEHLDETLLHMRKAGHIDLHRHDHVGSLSKDEAHQLVFRKATEKRPEGGHSQGDLTYWGNTHPHGDYYAGAALVPNWEEIRKQENAKYTEEKPLQHLPHDLKKESGTGYIYSEKRIHPKHLEIATTQGWHPLTHFIKPQEK